MTIRSSTRWFTTIVVAGTISVGAAMSDVAGVVLNPVSDNSIYEENGSLSNGAGAYLFAGNTGLDQVRRALVKFDLTQVPTGAAIDIVSLAFTCTLSPAANPTPQTFSLHRVTADWGEAGSDAGEPGGIGAPAQTGDATWTARFFGEGMPWITPGGNFDPTPSATGSIGVCSPGSPATLAFVSPQLISDVEAWIADPSSNFGWILIGNEGELSTARRFLSRDTAAQTEPFPPQLFVGFAPIGTPAVTGWGAIAAGALLLLAGSAALLRRTRTAP